MNVNIFYCIKKIPYMHSCTWGSARNIELLRQSAPAKRLKTIALNRKSAKLQKCGFANKIQKILQFVVIFVSVS